MVMANMMDPLMTKEQIEAQNIELYPDEEERSGEKWCVCELDAQIRLGEWGTDSAKAVMRYVYPLSLQLCVPSARSDPSISFPYRAVLSFLARSVSGTHVNPLPGHTTGLPTNFRTCRGVRRTGGGVLIALRGGCGS